VDSNDFVDERAKKSNQRIIRHPGWICTVEDIPKTALELIEEWTVEIDRGNYNQVRARLDAITEAIKEGRAT
jgi:hypothetical protein